MGFLYINSLAQIPQLINEQESRVLIQAKKNVSIIIDYANIDHENIIDQLLKIGGDNEK